MKNLTLLTAPHVGGPIAVIGGFGSWILSATPYFAFLSAICGSVVGCITLWKMIRKK